MFKFSNAQMEIFNEWVRPKDEAMPIDDMPSGERSEEPELPIIAQNKIDLVQDMTSDCSIVASLCAIIARAERSYDGVSRHLRFFVQARLKTSASLLIYVPFRQEKYETCPFAQRQICLQAAFQWLLPEGSD